MPYQYQHLDYDQREIKAVLTIDIVDFSKKSNDEMSTLTQLLFRLLHLAIPGARNTEAARIWSPGGDGGSLTFTKVADAHYTAISLSKLVNNHNDAVDIKQRLYIRMGIDIGTVFKALDFDQRENIWGHAINSSTRIAGLAQPGQILASELYCKQLDLTQLDTPLLEEISIQYLGQWWVKHNVAIAIYNIFAKNSGLPVENVEEWYLPFNFPLIQTVQTYESMLQEYKNVDRNLKCFRLLVIAKRLLDLYPKNAAAQETIQQISQATSHSSIFDPFFSSLSKNVLFFLLKNMNFVDYSQGEYIAQKGDEATFLGVIVAGTIGITFDKEEIHSYQFGEGEFIGEMGLLETEPIRNATLVALQNTWILRLDYKHLVDSRESPHENQMRSRIKRSLWVNYYVRRLKENMINSYWLFACLTHDEKSSIINDGETEIISLKHDRNRELQVNEVWDSFIIVVKGNVTLYGKYDGLPVKYGRDDCIGLGRMSNQECFFAHIDSDTDSLLISMPWSTVEYYLESNETFNQNCYAHFRDVEQIRWHYAI